MTVQITLSEFRKLENRFVFQGGSEFGNSIADALERLTAENAALKEGLDGWHARYLDCEVERDVEKEHVRQCISNIAKLVAERDALAGEKK